MNRLLALFFLPHLVLLPYLTAVAAEESLLNFEQICARLTLESEVFVFDRKSGNLMEKKEQHQLSKSSSFFPDKRERKTEQKKCRLVSHWSSRWLEGEPQLALFYQLILNPDKSLTLDVAQYQSDEEMRKKTKPYKQKTFEIKDMGSVQWESPLHKNQRFVVRFTPDLTYRKEPLQISDLNISGTNMMLSDRDGHIWADHFAINGKYIAMITHLGGIALSYTPFKGSVLLGVSEGKEMRFRLESGKYLRLHSDQYFAPPGTSVKVFGLPLDRKTQQLNTVSTHTSDSEREFLKKLGLDPESI